MFGIFWIILLSSALRWLQTPITWVYYKEFPQEWWPVECNGRLPNQGILAVGTVGAQQRVNSMHLSWPRLAVQGCVEVELYFLDLSGLFSLKTTSLFCSIILCIYNIYQQSTIGQTQNEKKNLYKPQFLPLRKWPLKGKRENLKTHTCWVHGTSHFALGFLSHGW